MFEPAGAAVFRSRCVSNSTTLLRQPRMGLLIEQAYRIQHRRDMPAEHRALVTFHQPWGCTTPR
ncbi:MAG: hypothetical protein GYA52_02060 [Chloroflexi bacterium]|nr:hypothetical protein [Chloroflexota bacterium]